MMTLRDKLVVRKKKHIISWPLLVSSGYLKILSDVYAYNRLTCTR